MCDEKKLDLMIQLAEKTGVSLDRIVADLRQLDQTCLEAISERPSRLPRYMKSNVKP